MVCVLYLLVGALLKIIRSVLTFKVGTASVNSSVDAFYFPDKEILIKVCCR